jgi:hypothetical protein
MRSVRARAGARARLAIVALGVVLGSACYTFEPVGVEALGPGNGVRARLTPAGAQLLGELTGDPSNVLEGAFVSGQPDRLRFALWRSDLARPGFRPGQVEIELPRGDVVEVERKRLSRLRTGLLSAGLVGGLLLLIDALGSGAGGFLSGGDDGGI